MKDNAVCNSGAGGTFHDHIENARPTTISGGANSRLKSITRTAFKRPATVTQSVKLCFEHKARLCYSAHPRPGEPATSVASLGNGHRARTLPPARLNTFMAITQHDIRRAVRALGLAGQPLCLHGSLRSFGHIEGGAPAVVRPFLEEGCTLMVPTFSSTFEVAPPPHLQFERNGWEYGAGAAPRPGTDKIYTPEAPDIDRDMGAIPAAVLGWPGRARGRHPLDSFTAVGPRAAEVVAGQAPLDVYALLKALARAGASSCWRAWGSRG